jgi:hypothetical protein
MLQVRELDMESRLCDRKIFRFDMYMFVITKEEICAQTKMYCGCGCGCGASFRCGMGSRRKMGVIRGEGRLKS